MKAIFRKVGEGQSRHQRVACIRWMYKNSFGENEI
jgi:hypothetical protein